MTLTPARGPISQLDQKLARTAGLLYLLFMPTTALHFGITGNLTTGDPAAAIAGLRVIQESYQLAIISGAAGYVFYLLTGLALYRLFRPVHEAAATVMMAFVGIHVAISLAAIGQQLDALALLRDPLLPDAGKAGQVALSLLGFNSLFRLSLIFSGLWLAPLGGLVYRCGFLPKLVGICLMLGSVWYVMTFAGWVMDPHYDESLVGRTLGIVSGIPSLIGEAGTCISLLVVGFRRNARPAA